MTLGRRVTIGSRVSLLLGILCYFYLFNLFHIEDRVARGARVALP